jgi:hypothetical protein
MHISTKDFDQGIGLMFKIQFPIAHPFPFVILTKDFNERVSKGEFTKFSFIQFQNFPQDFNQGSGWVFKESNPKVLIIPLMISPKILIKD